MKPAHAVPLASARKHPENQKENQAGHSSERAVEGQEEAGAHMAFRMAFADLEVAYSPENAKFSSS